MRLVNHNIKEQTKVGRVQIFFSFWFIAVVAVVLSAILWQTSKFVIEYFERFTKYNEIIDNAGLRNGVDPCLIRAVIWKESKFDRTVIGSKGEIGLMQVLQKYAAQDWAKAHHVDVPSQGALADPSFNIEVGTWYLGKALRRWKDYNDCVALALCEYNAGYSRANSWKPDKKDGSVLERISIPSTRGYVESILKKYQEYQEE